MPQQRNLLPGQLGVSEDPAELLARQAGDETDAVCEACGLLFIVGELEDGFCEDCLPEAIEAEKEAERKQLRYELRRMLLWHDAVREVHPIIPSPYHIRDTREVAGATP